MNHEPTSRDRPPTQPEQNRPRHPEITVQLTCINGNAFNILGTVRRALEAAGLNQDEIDAFHTEATSGDYDHLLQTCMRWVDVQ